MLDVYFCLHYIHQCPCPCKESTLTALYAVSFKLSPMHLVRKLSTMKYCGILSWQVTDKNTFIQKYMFTKKKAPKRL